MARHWNKLTVEPPVSAGKSRTWLELYLPDRAQAAETGDRFGGLALGVYLGSGTFRIAGERNATLEKVTAWRFLAGNARPIESKGLPSEQVHRQTGVEAPGP